jgi:hypothetical protein
MAAVDDHLINLDKIPQDLRIREDLADSLSISWQKPLFRARKVRLRLISEIAEIEDTLRGDETIVAAALQKCHKPTVDPLPLYVTQVKAQPFRLSQ